MLKHSSNAGEVMYGKSLSLSIMKYSHLGKEKWQPLLQKGSHMEA